MDEHKKQQQLLKLDAVVEAVKNPKIGHHNYKLIADLLNCLQAVRVLREHLELHCGSPSAVCDMMETFWEICIKHGIDNVSSDKVAAFQLLIAAAGPPSNLHKNDAAPAKSTNRLFPNAGSGE